MFAKCSTLKLGVVRFASWNVIHIEALVFSSDGYCFSEFVIVCRDVKSFIAAVCCYNLYQSHNTNLPLGCGNDNFPVGFNQLSSVHVHSNHVHEIHIF